jgi:hypothetical protein
MERRELADKLRARKEEKMRLAELKLQEEQRILREKEVQCNALLLLICQLISLFLNRNYPR